MGIPFPGGIEVIPSSSLGSPFPSDIEAIPGSSMGPAFEEEILVTDPDPVLPIKDVTGSIVPKEIIEQADALKVAYIKRETSGPAYMWDDDNVTTIQIGGGANHSSTTIGKRTGTIRIAEQLDLQDSSLLMSGPMQVGSDDLLILGARGETIQVNEPGNTNLNTPFYSSVSLSIIAAINEAISKPARYLADIFTNAETFQINEGACVYLAVQGSVLEASATADNAASVCIGAVSADIAAGEDGPVAYEGEITIKFAPGEGTLSHARKPVYLSTTDGYGTLTAPSSSGNVILLLGYVVDDTGYDNTAGGTMLVQRVRAQRRVIP
jgi:hypothetical protein